MSSDVLQALDQIAREKEMSVEALMIALEAALATAYKRIHSLNSDVKVKINPGRHSNFQYRVYMQKMVVDEVMNNHLEIDLDQAQTINPGCQAGDIVEIDLPTSMEEMTRIAAQTVKNVLTQRIREEERKKTFDEYNARTGEVLTGTVQRKEGSNVIISLGKIDAYLPLTEQVETEKYTHNVRLKVYVLEVKDAQRGPQVIVSRTHPTLIRRLFELEVPEIADGTVTIKSVVREPGARSKVAVVSKDDKVDPQGACIGQRGSRVQSIVNELFNEKIDVVRWSADPSSYISESLSPAKPSKVIINEDSKGALVIVPDNQLSLAIGKSGQNVRLAARLTGWRIDIRSEAQVAREELMALTNFDHDSETEIQIGEQEQ